MSYYPTVGEVVRLKSGGPKMTVTQVRLIRCEWSEWNGVSETQLFDEYYDQDVVVPVEEESEGKAKQ